MKTDPSKNAEVKTDPEYYADAGRWIFEYMYGQTGYGTFATKIAAGMKAVDENKEIEKMLAGKGDLLLRLSTYIVLQEKLSSEEKYDALMDAKRVVKMAAQDELKELKGEK